jgi:hypothetical protein
VRVAQVGSGKWVFLSKLWVFILTPLTGVDWKGGSPTTLILKPALD